MKKGYISDRILKRFLLIDKFVEKKKRLPTNEEIARMFNLVVGGSTKEFLDKYQSQNNVCRACGNPNPKNKKKCCPSKS